MVSELISRERRLNKATARGETKLSLTLGCRNRLMGIVCSGISVRGAGVPLDWMLRQHWNWHTGCIGNQGRLR